MKKSTFGIATSALSGVLLAVLVACSVPTNNNQTNLNNDNQLNQNTKLSRYALTGKVDFGNSGFKTKANFADLISGASVTLLDPSNNNNALGASVSTDANGNFTFVPTTSFLPVTNQVYVLEATKRPSVNASLSPLVSLRSYVRWTGSAYIGMTTPNIFLNTYTTALSIIALKGEVSPNSTIGTISVSGNTSTPTAIAASGGFVGADLTKITNVTKLVQQSINFQADPINTVSLNSGTYSLNISPTSALSNNGQGTQIDRLALPSLNIVINGYNGFTSKAYDQLAMTKAMRDSAKDTYNSESPDTDVNNYRNFWTTAIGAVFPDSSKTQGQLTASQLATALTPDVQTIDMTKVTSFATLNGRLLSDDVVDIELRLLSGVSNATDGVNANDKSFTNTFPYLAGPQ